MSARLSAEAMKARFVLLSYATFSAASVSQAPDCQSPRNLSCWNPVAPAKRPKSRRQDDMARPTEVSRRDCQGCNASGFPAAFQSPAEIRGDLWAGLFSLPRSLPYVTDLSLFGLLSGEGVRAFTSCISNSSFAWSCRTGLGWRRSLQARHAMQSKAKSPSTPTAAMTPPSTMSDGGGGESGEGGRRYTSSSFGSDARKRVDRSGESATPSGCVPRCAGRRAPGGRRAGKARSLGGARRIQYLSAGPGGPRTAGPAPGRRG